MKKPIHDFTQILKDKHSGVLKKKKNQTIVHYIYR